MKKLNVKILSIDGKFEQTIDLGENLVSLDENLLVRFAREDFVAFSSECITYFEFLKRGDLKDYLQENKIALEVKNCRMKFDKGEVMAWLNQYRPLAAARIIKRAKVESAIERRLTQLKKQLNNHD